jgi:hypothetical protein
MKEQMRIDEVTEVEVTEVEFTGGTPSRATTITGQRGERKHK